MLSEEEQAALDSWRSPCTTYAALRVLADAIDRLYPPGWNDPVTPERLVELGGEYWHDDKLWVVFRNGENRVDCHNVLSERRAWAMTWRAADGLYEDARLYGHTCPRNMKEARELLVRCGAIKEEK
jgi:hypothetical protein